MSNNKIIDSVLKLIELSDDEIDELLLDEKYNKANLRELVRRSLKATKEYKRALEYEQNEREEALRILSLYDKNWERMNI